MDGVAGCHGAPEFMALSPARPLLESLSTGEPGAEQLRHGEHRVGVGRQQVWGVEGGAARKKGLRRLVAPSDRGQVTVGQ